mgnify:CR=1 FL=1
MRAARTRLVAPPLRSPPPSSLILHPSLSTTSTAQHASSTACASPPAATAHRPPAHLSPPPRGYRGRGSSTARSRVPPVSRAGELFWVRPPPSPLQRPSITLQHRLTSLHPAPPLVLAAFLPHARARRRRRARTSRGRLCPLRLDLRLDPRAARTAAAYARVESADRAPARPSTAARFRRPAAPVLGSASASGPRALASASSLVPTASFDEPAEANELVEPALVSLTFPLPPSPFPRPPPPLSIP